MMLIVTAEMDNEIKVIEGTECPNGKIRITLSRRDHLARTKMATNKIDVLILVKSKNVRQ